MDVDVLAHAVGMWERREAFAIATVVWRRAPSSGHLGSKAIIHRDGSIDGWLGGACAQPTVVHEALAAMDDGQPRLLLLGQPDDLRHRPDDGILKVPMACESEGALEIYLEPVLPPPRVVVIGRSPAVFALTRMALDLGWDVEVVDDGGDPTVHPHPELVRTTLRLDELDLAPGSAVVVATQGTYDDLALAAALDTDAGYIGLVAAGKRASTTLELLRQRGIPDQELARVVAPAGLDLGAVDNPEIAVAVLAELVARRAAGSWSVGATSARGAVTVTASEAIDPVCGMLVDLDQTRYRTRHDGVEHGFCSAGCLARFQDDPASFLRH